MVRGGSIWWLVPLGLVWAAVIRAVMWWVG